MSTPTEHDVVAHIPRNLLLGIAIAFVVVVSVCLVVGLDLSVAIGVAALPSVFSGPFVGGMLIMASYNRVEGHE